MDNTKYIGMDVHQATISIAVLNSSGKLVMESVIETKAITIVQFVRGLRGEPSPRSGRPKPFALVQEGWKVRNYPAEGEVIFLTFPFIELLRPYSTCDAEGRSEDSFQVADYPYPNLLTLLDGPASSA
jgi:hypothetical protein